LGKENTRADWGLRHLTDSSDWRLNQKVVASLSSIHHRLVRLLNQCITASICQLATRPSGMDSGCLLNFLKGLLPLYVSTLHSDIPMSMQTEEGSGDSPPNLHQFGPIRPGFPNYCDTRLISQFCSHQHSQTPNNDRPPLTSRLASLRRTYGSEGLSD